MPIYEYECDDCGHELEIMRKLSDGPLTACPACGKEGLRKIISKVAFRLKGTGWYETDFKTKPAEAKSAESDQTEKKETKEKKDGATKDDKPSTKTGSATKTATKTGE
jgi:putative FmdB family regulatory protein